MYWFRGPRVHWSIGSLVQWSIRSLVHLSIGPLVHCQMSYVKCQMSEIKCQMFIRLNFCRSIPNFFKKRWIKIIKWSKWTLRRMNFVPEREEDAEGNQEGQQGHRIACNVQNYFIRSDQTLCKSIFPTLLSKSKLTINCFDQSICTIHSKGRVPKKNPYFLWSFAKRGGGGSARVVKKPYCFFEKSIFSESM